MKHRDIANEINRENERRLLRPLVFGLIIALFLVPILGILVLKFADDIDSFCSKHPDEIGLGLIVGGAYLWYRFGRYNDLW